MYEPCARNGFSKDIILYLLSMNIIVKKNIGCRDLCSNDFKL